MKKIVVPYRAVFPTPAALISSIDAEGKPNVATAGEVFMLSLRPLIVGVGFRRATYTNRLIHETAEFVVNLPTKEVLRAVDYCGCVSGLNEDKFKSSGLTAMPAMLVKPPIIKECPVNIECKVRDVISFPYMDREVFAGEALTVHVNEEVMGEDGLPDLTKFTAIAFASWRYYEVAKLLEKMNFSIKD